MIINKMLYSALEPVISTHDLLPCLLFQARIPFSGTGMSPIEIKADYAHKQLCQYCTTACILYCLLLYIAGYSGKTIDILSLTGAHTGRCRATIASRELSFISSRWLSCNQNVWSLQHHHVLTVTKKALTMTCFAWCDNGDSMTSKS